MLENLTKFMIDKKKTTTQKHNIDYTTCIRGCLPVINALYAITDTAIFDKCDN